VDEDEDEDDCDLLEDDDIWEKLTGDADAGGNGDDVAAALPEDIDLPDAQWEREVEGAHAEAVAQRDANASLWAAIEQSASASHADPQPPRLGGPRRASIPSHRLKHATARQVFASSQFNQADKAKSEAFFKRWQKEHKAHREKVNLALAQRQDKERLLAKKKADRLARQEARRREKEAELAARRDSRGFDQLMRQGADKEKAEARCARGKGATYVMPSEQTFEKKGDTMPVIRVAQLCPSIKVPAAVVKKVDAWRAKRKAAAASSAAAPKGAADPCSYFRAFKKRERK